MLKTTIYENNIFELDNYQFKILKPSTNKKLGKKVLKGKYKDYKFVTLTLVERETCPKDCIHWLNCYGNNMPFAHRISSKNAQLLEERIYNDLLNSTNQLLLIRLHILGDFFSVKYVKFWRKMLNTFNNIALYGYTANNIKSSIPLSQAIAKEIIKLNKNDNCHIRFSNDLTISFSANSYDIVKPVKGVSLVCPVQENKRLIVGRVDYVGIKKTSKLYLKHIKKS